MSGQTSPVCERDIGWFVSQLKVILAAGLMNGKRWRVLIGCWHVFPTKIASFEAYARILVFGLVLTSKKTYVGMKKGNPVPLK